MKKKIAVLLLVVFTTLQLFACGSNNHSAESENTADSDGSTTDSASADSVASETSESNNSEITDVVSDTGNEVSDTIDEISKDTTALETDIEIVFDKKNAVKFIEGTGEADGGNRKLKMYIDINNRVVAIEDVYDFPESKDYEAKKLFVGYTPESYKITLFDSDANHLEYEYMPSVLENYKKMSYETVKSIIFSKLSFREAQDISASVSNESISE